MPERTLNFIVISERSGCFTQSGLSFIFSYADIQRMAVKRHDQRECIATPGVPIQKFQEDFFCFLSGCLGARRFKIDPQRDLPDKLRTLHALVVKAIKVPALH